MGTDESRKMIILLTVVATIAAMIAVQRLAVRFAVIDTENDFLDDLSCRVYGFCEAMGWSFPAREPEDVPGLDRYPEDGDNPFIPFVTKIVVPDEYSREQVMRALRYLHDQFSTDTGYMAVNYLVHLYSDEDGEPTGRTPWIVVEPKRTFAERVERAAFALERQRNPHWTDAQFDTWWNRDPFFTKAVTAWGDGFRGTRKGRVISEAEAVLKADAA